MLLQQLQETEAEARELQDFLQMEKATLGEALRESEAEGKRLRAEMDERGVTVKQLEAVSYTHLTLPTNREV